MIKHLLSATVLLAASAGVAFAQNPAPSSSVPRKPETPVLKKEEYRQRLDEVIVIGQEPYWRKEGTPRWDRGKTDVDVSKPATEPRMQLFPNYTTEERDESLKIKDRNNASPQIKIFESKF